MLGMERCSSRPTQWYFKKFDNGPKQIKDFLKDHLASCLKMIQ
jgi:hypothetical protein